MSATLSVTHLSLSIYFSVDMYIYILDLFLDSRFKTHLFYFISVIEFKTQRRFAWFSQLFVYFVFPLCGCGWFCLLIKILEFVCGTAFRYQKNQYNVFEVNQTGYDNCTTESAVGNWSSGKDFVPLNEAKRYYFICGNGQCYSGMKVSVLVHPLSPPPSAAVKNSTTNSTAAVVPPRGFGVLVVSFVVICFGSGWM